METVNVEKLIIAIFVIMIAVSLFKAIYKGVKEGIQTAFDIKNGATAEDIARKNKEELDRRKEEEKQKLNSRLYKITHPLQYFNDVLFSKIEDFFRSKKK